MSPHSKNVPSSIPVSTKDDFLGIERVCILCRFPSIMLRLGGYPKLPIGVNVSLNGYSSVFAL